MIRAVIAISLIFFSASVTISQTPKAIEDELLGHLDKLEKASNYGGTADYDVLGNENKELRAALIKYGSRSDVLTYQFPRLKDKLFLATSRNGKLRTYSWDSEEGGTMHDFCTVYQFHGKSDNVHTFAEQCSHDLEKQVAGAFTIEIFQTDTSTGPIYIAVSTFIGSTSLAGQFISALKIDGEHLDRDPKVIRTANGLTSGISFEYDFFSVVNHEERPIKLVFYDQSKKEFRFPVVIEDKETPQGRVTDKFITYRFNGEVFVKV